jgi:hypothetical protein
VAKESDRRPGESDRAWSRRLAEMGQAAKFARRDEVRERKLRHQANRESVQGDDEMLDYLGGAMTPKPSGELEDMLVSWRQDVDAEPLADLVTPQAAKDAIDFSRAVRAGKKNKANRLYKRNRGQWNKAAKKYNARTKSNKGCLGWLFDWS